MAEEQDRSQQTQEPTEKKLRDARKKGDVPSSRETGNMMVVVSLIVIVSFILHRQIPELVQALSGLIDMSGKIPVSTGEPGLTKIGQVSREFIMSITRALAPVFMALIVGALLGVLIQGETVASLDRVRPKLSKLSPAQGIKRLFSAGSFVEFAKNTIKVLVVGALALWVAYGAVHAIWEGPGFIPEVLPGYISEASRKLLTAAAVFLVPVAIVDILWRRFDWRRRQMMTMKEVRDEMKESEGDPQIKGRRAAIRRQRAQQSIAVAVPTASVILTNPTHFAVALRYVQGNDAAPVCVAKGTDLMARQIRKIALENDIPIVENKPLARALHEVVEVDDMIPVKYWEVVAEIIGFIMDMRRDKNRKLPAGSTLQTSLD